MGYQERDYYREEGTSDPLGIGALSMTTKLIIVTVLVYLIDMFFGVERTVLPGNRVIETHHIANFLALKANWFVKPWEIYGLLSHGFAHDPDDPRHILFNMIGFFCFARMLEDRWGGKALLRFYLAAIVFCGLVWSARHFFLGDPRATCVGASGGVTACIILFCLQNPKATIFLMFVPMPAWIAGIVIVVINMLGVDFSSAPGKPQTAFDAHLAGAVFAVAIWGLKINFARMAWLDAPGSWFKKLGGYFKSRPNLRVHTDSAHYSSGGDEDEDLEMEGDRILAKISTQGDASLTAKERRTLEKYSRLMRERRK